MLKQLYIKNFTLIDELDIELYPGFSVITGETGAGKSIILGAIGLLLGQRADSKSIKAGADKCIIEAHFDLSRYHMEAFFEENEIEQDTEDTIIRRELTSAGKSRSFINDTPVGLSQLKELGEQLVDIHSQHQNLLLQKQDFQLSVVDIIAQDAQQLADYEQSFNAYQQAQRQLKELAENIEQGRQQTDFMQFQYDELDNAHLTEGEQEELEQQSETMEHAEDIKSALYETNNALNGEELGTVSQVRKAMLSLQGISKVLPKASELAERLHSCHIELKDIADEVESSLEDVDFDPAELDHINQRLDHLYDLEKKYHADTVSDLIVLRDELKEKLNAIENSDEALAELDGAGNASKIIAALKPLRDRVGMPAMDFDREYNTEADYPFKSLNKYVQAVRRERRVEQALEGRRFYDIARWAAADVHMVNWTPQGALFTGSDLPTLRDNYSELVYDQASGNNLFLTGAAGDAKRYIVPIPPGTMSGGYKFRVDRDYLLPFQQRLLTLTDNKWQQNPGW